MYKEAVSKDEGEMLPRKWVQFALRVSGSPITKLPYLSPLI
jgi:hypothetical protein